MADSSSELADQNPTGRFSDRADDYVRYRPTYPAAAIDAILDGLSPPIVAADVGAGTGISARLLAARGGRVIAVEPNAAMRAAGEADERIEWRDGTAEATGLAAAAVDLVLCAQSFHWFRPPEALAEFARILKPGGRLCLMWNQRDPNDPFTSAYTQALLEVGAEHPMERRPFDPLVVASTGDFETPRCLEFPNTQRLDLPGLIGRAQSASYAPKQGQAHEEMVRQLTAIFQQGRDKAGCVTLRYVTRTYLSLRIEPLDRHCVDRMATRS
ncbi:MAG: class I SAM-dependent methyltransferase [Planctomycetaceae bacterium]|nr:class I SAM-dependent methyltransferase [Planctomycetaceae bacterium]